MTCKFPWPWPLCSALLSDYIFLSSKQKVYATATSYRQCIQKYADKHHCAMYTSYKGTGPGRAQAWRAQIRLTQKRGGQEVTLMHHTSTHCYSNQADAKEAASAEVWTMLFASC
jgi:hypothetical protein